MELFEEATSTEGQPLAHRMRPRTLDEFIGQGHIVGTGRLLRRVIQADRLSSVIFYGPPGTGKTTLASVIANSTASHFITMNAVLSGVKELRVAIEEARNKRSLYGRRTLLFVDEVHRWNKAQQDALLPWVENGTVILIGATTQNPFFEVNSALVSRSRIFQLHPLSSEELSLVCDSALADENRGYGGIDVELDDEARQHLINVANGDARSLLNALELAVETTPPHFPPDPGSHIHVTVAIAEESIQKKVVLYDKEGDYHFDAISAFIKSIRGSDPDAALYWMARMIYAGEDAKYLFRRMLISAAEDIGLADPAAIGVVVSAAEAFDRVGLPEGHFFLSEAALYLATTDKSNSTLGFFDALGTLEREQTEDVPSHLKDASRDGPRLGHGEGYLYPHAYRDHWVAQQYLPDSLRGTFFYQPGHQGHEGVRRRETLRRREAQHAAYGEMQLEVLAPAQKKGAPIPRYSSLAESRIDDGRAESLRQVQSHLFELALVSRGQTILDLNAESGLLIWEARRVSHDGTVVGLVRDRQERVETIASQLDESERPRIIEFDPQWSEEPSERSVAEQFGADSFQRIVGFNVFAAYPRVDRLLSVARLLMAEDSILAVAESLPRNGQLLADLPILGSLDSNEVRLLREAELDVRASETIEGFRWRTQAVSAALHESGFVIAEIEERSYWESRRLGGKEINAWLSSDGSSRYGSAIAARIGENQLEETRAHILDRIEGETTPWMRRVLFVKATR